MATSTRSKRAGTTRTRKPARKARVTKTLRKGDLDTRKMYELAVQSPEVEIDFLTSTFRRLKGRPLRLLREDFSASAASACEFVKRHKDNRAVALDLHRPVLEWGRKHNVGALPEAARPRIKLLERNVLHPGQDGTGVDAIAAMNFSYWIFNTRQTLLQYFTTAHKTLTRDGVLFLDAHGGWEASKLMTERRRIYAKGSSFTYVWDQARFDPLTNNITCRIHFEFKKGPPARNAFTYHWRLWSIAEIFELLQAAGFRSVTLYQEGDDGKGGGNSIYTPVRKRAEHCASFVCYIVAEK